MQAIKEILERIEGKIPQPTKVDADVRATFKWEDGDDDGHGPV